MLKNLDAYATALGWDKWPVPQLNQNRVAADGTRGSGSLYALGLNYSLTGIFYNKKLAAQIGMTQPPQTLDEFESLLAKAKSAGLQPIMEWGSAKSGMGLAFPLQALMASLGPTGPINDWIFQKKGATIDTPSNLQAAQHLQQWITNGYFPKDINAIEYTDSNARFVKGEGVFTFNGDWENADYDKNLAGNVGFFLMPSAQAGGSPAAMSAPLTYGIAAKAKNADCAAFFLTWVASNPTARQIDVAVGGSNPGGPADATVPTVAGGSITNDTLAAGPVMGKAGTAMDFIANSTSSIFAQGWTPELQKMVGGKQYEIVAEFGLNPDRATQFGFRLRTAHGQGLVIAYDVDSSTLTLDRGPAGAETFAANSVPATPSMDKVKLTDCGAGLKMQILVDWSSVEVFANGGQAAMTACIFPDEDSVGLELYTLGGDVRLNSLAFYPLSSATPQ